MWRHQVPQEGGCGDIRCPRRVGVETSGAPGGWVWRHQVPQEGGCGDIRCPRRVGVETSGAPGGWVWRHQVPQEGGCGDIRCPRRVGVETSGAPNRRSAVVNLHNRGVWTQGGVDSGVCGLRGCGLRGVWTQGCVDSGGCGLRGCGLRGCGLGGVDSGGVDSGGVDSGGVDSGGVDSFRLCIGVFFNACLATFTALEMPLKFFVFKPSYCTVDVFLSCLPENVLPDFEDLKI